MIASGRIASRTTTVRAMIDQAHGSPVMSWMPKQQAVERVLERAEHVGERARSPGRHRIDRVMAREGMAVAEPAQREQRAAQRRRARGSPPRRSASSWARSGRSPGPPGTSACTTKRHSVDRPEQEPERDAPHAALPARARGELAHLGLEPIEPLLGERLGQARAGRRSRDRRRRRGPASTRADASRRSRLTRLRSTAPPTLRETVSPTRGSLALGAGIARERVDDEVPRRRRAAPPVDGVEVSGAREAPAARGGTRHDSRPRGACARAGGGA